MEKTFYSLKEAAVKLNLTEDQVSNLVETNRLQEFRDSRNLLFLKVTQVDLLSQTDIILMPTPQKKESQDRYGKTMLIMWIICGIVFILGLISRNIEILEIGVPIFSFLGFIFLGINLYSHYKQRQKILEQKSKDEDLEKVLDNVERIKALNEKPLGDIK